MRVGAVLVMIALVAPAAMPGAAGQEPEASEGAPDGRLVAACPPNLPAAGFDDVDGGAHAAAIDCVAWWDVTRGDGHGRYRPGVHIRRDQLASMLGRILFEVGRPAGGSDGQAFDDVAGNVHAEAINALAGMGVIRGMSETRFAPSNAVRRDQMASLLVRLHEARFAPLPAGAGGDGFADIAGNVHADAIGKLAAAGITGGVSPTVYDSAGRVTRAQMASFLMRLLALWVRDGLVDVVGEEDPALREGNAASHSPSVSASGRHIAFVSQASNLVEGDTGGAAQVFVRDRARGRTTLVSVGGDGQPADGDASGPSISGDGRQVAFASDASNLVAGDTNATTDVFVHDRDTGQTTRVSVSSAGVQADGHSGTPAISADGNHVAFASTATNLSEGAAGPHANVHVHDRRSGETTTVSVARGGGQANGPSGAPSISRDGRLIVLSSQASNLVDGDSNGASDVFVHDRDTGRNTRVSVPSGSGRASGPSRAPSISANGDYIAYETAAPELVSGAGDIAQTHVLRYERDPGTSTLITGHAKGASSSPVVADDGRVAYLSTAPNMAYPPPGDISLTHVYEWHPWDDRIVRLSVNDELAEADDHSRQPAISSNGEVVAFVTPAPTLTRATFNRISNVIAHTWRQGKCIAILISAASLALSGDQPPEEAPDDESVYLYRGGSATPRNFTPRLGADTVDYPRNGLSLFSNRDRACHGNSKVQGIDPALVAGAASQHLRLAIDASDPEHFHLQADTEELHVEWAERRERTTDADHHWLADVAVNTIVLRDLRC